MSQGDPQQIVDQLRALLESSQKTAARMETAVDRTLTRADQTLSDSLRRADELTNGLRELSLERQRYVEEVRDLRERLAEREAVAEASAREIAELITRLEDTGAQVRHLAEARDRAERESSALRNEEQRLSRELLAHRQDLALKEAYLIEVRRQADQAAQAAAEEAARTAAAAAEAVALASSRPPEPDPQELIDAAGAEATTVLEQQLVRAHDEHARLLAAWEQSREEIEGYKRTLALPRYVMADAINGLLRPLRPLHATLKKLARQGRNGGVHSSESSRG